MSAPKKKSPELKPCKHCGRKPTLRRMELGFAMPYRDARWQVTCRCGIRTKLYKTQSGAVRAWNREAESEVALIPAARALIAHCNKTPDCERCIFWNQYATVPDCMFRFGAPQVWDVPEEEVK